MVSKQAQTTCNMAVNDMIVKKNLKPSLRTKIKMSLLVKIVQTRWQDHNGVKIGSNHVQNGRE